MNINLSAVLAIVFLLMLAVLGHGAWHSGLVSFLNIAVNLFTGARVVG